MRGAARHFPDQLRELYVRPGTVPSHVAVLMGTGEDFGKFLARSVKAGAMEGVGGTVIEISSVLAPLVLALLRRGGGGYAALTASLERDLSRCGGLGTPLAVLWYRPGGKPMLCLSTCHPCSLTWQIPRLPAGVVHGEAALLALRGRALPRVGELPLPVGVSSTEAECANAVKRYGCRMCTYADNVVRAEGQLPLLPRGLPCNGACDEAGLVTLTIQQRKTVRKRVRTGSYSLRLATRGSGSVPVSQAWVRRVPALAEALRAQLQAEAAAEAAALEAAAEQAELAALAAQAAAAAAKRAAAERAAAWRKAARREAARSSEQAALAADGYEAAATGYAAAWAMAVARGTWDSPFVRLLLRGG